jgi:RNA polymerase sigma factor (sigma-70 family)
MNAPRPDGELLMAFAGQADQAAFAELVERHGAMVVRVAEAILRDRHGAEDVAQAAFLVLARKASSLRQSETVAPWLHRVAWRLAIDEFRRRQSRQRREEENVRMNTPASPADLSAVHEELGALPDRYRSPLVVCYLEGEPPESAARRLGLSAEALRKRLERARELLRKKLVRRGVAVSSGTALATLLSAEAGAATFPAALLATTTQAAVTGVASAGVAALVKGSLLAMQITKLKLAGMTVASLLLIGGGALVLKNQMTPNAAAPQPQPVAPPSATRIPPATVTTATVASATATAHGLILRMANPPMVVTDSRGQGYVAKNVTNFPAAVWRHYSRGMDPSFCAVFRVTEAEQIQLQQMLDAVWQGADSLATCFDVRSTNGALVVTWKGDAFRDVYRAQREATRNQVLTGAHGILGAERGEVLGWLPQAGNIGWPDVLPDPARVSGDYRLTVSVTNANGVIAMRYAATLGEKRSVRGQNPGLGPWPALGEQLGVPRQTVLSNLAAQRQKPSPKGLFQYRDPAVPVDEVPLAAEDAATGARYIYVPMPAR